MTAGSNCAPSPDLFGQIWDHELVAHASRGQCRAGAVRPHPREASLLRNCSRRQLIIRSGRRNKPCRQRCRNHGLCIAFDHQRLCSGIACGKRGWDPAAAPTIRSGIVTSKLSAERGAIGMASDYGNDAFLTHCSAA